jgi:hypothetical protein
VTIGKFDLEGACRRLFVVARCREEEVVTGGATIKNSGVAYSNWLGEMSCEIYLGFKVSS